MATHDINIKITADASGVNKAVSSAKSQLSSLNGTKVGGAPLAGLQAAAQASTSSIQGTSTAVRGLESALGTLKGVVAGAFAVGSITAFGKAALEASADFEFLKKGLNFQIGVDETNKLIAQMQQLGETSAYDSTQLIPMARKWINVGASADEAIGKMKMIVDAGSAFGLTAEQIKLCTDALTKMSSEGRINAEDMNALNDDGIPAWQLLSEAMGMPVEQLRKMSAQGALTGEAINALYDGIQNRTQGAAASMNDTLAAAFANLSETAANSMSGIGDIIDRTFGVKEMLQSFGDAAEEFKNHINSINESIKEGGDPLQSICNEIDAISPAIGAVVNTAVAGFNAIKAVISENITLIKNIAIGVTAAVTAYMSIMKVVSVFTAIKNAITVATVAMRLFGVAMTAVNAASALNPVVLAIAAIIAIIALLMANWDTVKAAAVSAMAAISSAISGVAEWLSSGFQSAVSAVSSIFSSIAETVSGVISSIGEGISAAAETISTVFTSIWESITAGVTAAITTIEGIIGAVAAWIGTNVVTPVVDNWISGINIIVGLASVLVAGIQAAWGAIVSWVASNVAQPLTEAFTAAWAAVTAGAAAVYSGIVGVFSAIGSWFSTNIGQPIAEAFQSAWSAVTESAVNAVVAISYAWDSVTEFFARIWQGIVSAAQEAWQLVTEVAAEAWAMVSAAWDAAVAFFAALWASIMSAAQSAWDTVTSVASSAWAAVQGAWEAASAWFQSSVWAPLCFAVSSVEAAITGAFQAAYSAVTGLFSGLANWFESNVIAPIKEKFNALANIGSSITGLRTSGGSASVTAEAKGGINGGPMRLATGGVVGGQIPALANGGTAHSGTIARIGEAGPEAVIPLKNEVLAKIGEAMYKASVRRQMLTKDATDAQKAQADAEDMLNDLQRKMVDQKGTRYQSTLLSNKKEIVDMHRQVSALTSQGADANIISELTAAVDEYEKVVKDRAWQDQLDAIKQFAATARKNYAQASHDYAGMAEAEYEATRLQLDKERRDKERELMQDADDARTRQEIEMDYHAKIMQAQEQRDKALREAHVDRINDLKEEGRLAAIIADADSNGSTWDADMHLEGMRSLAEQFIKYTKVLHEGWSNYATEISSELYSSMTDDFTEFIRGTKSAIDVVHDFGKTVLNMIAKIAAQRLAANMVSGLISALPFGGRNSAFSFGGTTHSSTFGFNMSNPLGLARGGIVTAPTLAMIGEGRDREAVIPLNNSVLSAIGGGKNSSVVVNITNNSDSKATVKSSRYDSGINKQILDIVIDGASRNVDGFGTNLKQALR